MKENIDSLRKKINDLIGKKVDITYDDGMSYSGYLFEHSYAEDSDVNEESITFAPLDKKYQLELPLDGISSIEPDPDFISFP